MRDSYGQKTGWRVLVICGYIRAVTGVTPLERTQDEDSDRRWISRSLSRGIGGHPSDLSQNFRSLSVSLCYVCEINTQLLESGFQFKRENAFFVCINLLLFSSLMWQITPRAFKWQSTRMANHRQLRSQVVGIYTLDRVLYRMSPQQEKKKRTTGDGWIAGWSWLITIL
jgi:hypothetical protein